MKKFVKGCVVEDDNHFEVGDVNRFQNDWGLPEMQIWISHQVQTNLNRNRLFALSSKLAKKNESLLFSLNPYIFIYHVPKRSLALIVAV